ncbi:MAG: protein translocase SEC61 complex subunit gamma [Candidatus Diapherotrites archaeon]|uniref:Protein translocase subunit SecE n=1 Tax=Candidatus Iainarchaeum sp. TaxID=3101447 RepID=A0A7J4L0N0_9ARCH|nr:MAG: protein transport protein Ssubunit gamma [archaeon GW2011_AR21]MBS3058776.1 protein translocase SEC61 complex subunit gamma [Candidatus Diapherotrites archaeon]HIH21472.1 protein translocase SEC61 complex subunit gamma [Candidatus Diapherotrites archaeon]HIH33196.1 protein translocase SEC61 complex subunit gamma [Candidatus Diapherotrites archaeon]
MIDISGKIRAFIDDSKRIFTISRKPTKEEFLTMLKVTGLGIIIIGIIGYIVSLVFFGLVFPPA